MFLVLRISIMFFALIWGTLFNFERGSYSKLTIGIKEANAAGVWTRCVARSKGKTWNVRYGGSSQSVCHRLAKRCSNDSNVDSTYYSSAVLLKAPFINCTLRDRSALKKKRSSRTSKKKPYDYGPYCDQATQNKYRSMQILRSDWDNDGDQDFVFFDGTTAYAHRRAADGRGHDCHHRAISRLADSRGGYDGYTATMRDDNGDGYDDVILIGAVHTFVHKGNGRGDFSEYSSGRYKK